MTLAILTPERYSPNTNSLHDALQLRRLGYPVLRIAEELGIPRSTVRDRFAAHDACPLPEFLKDAFATHEGEAFLKKLVLATHLHFRNLCACGLRMVGDFFEAIGLASLLGTSLGCQWKLRREIDSGIVDFGKEELHRLAPLVAGKEISAALGENFHEGPTLVGIEPVSNFILTETQSPSRDTQDLKDAMSPIMALLGIKVIQVVSDAARAIVALCEGVFGAHHSPDLFHVLYDFRRTFTPALRQVRKRLESALAAEERESHAFDRMIERWNQLTPAERGRGRPPDLETRKAATENAQAQIWIQLAELDRQEKQVVDALREISLGYHPVSLETGKRTGEASFVALFADAVARIHAVAVDLELAPFALESLDKLKRMGEKMAATLRVTTERWRGRAHAGCADAKERFALEAQLAPAAYLERRAARAGKLAAHGLHGIAEGLREQARLAIGAERIKELNGLALAMANDFQRSSSMVEGRNGELSLRHHAFHRLSELKRGVLTVLHNHVSRRADGTTAAERFGGGQSRDLLAWLCDRVGPISRAGGRRELQKAS